MAIICTVLHICNTTLPLHPPVLVYNITWIQNCSFVMFCTRDIKKKKKIKIKKKTTNCNWCEYEVWKLYHRKMYVITCMVRNLLFDLFIVPCLQRFFFFFFLRSFSYFYFLNPFSFFFYTLYPSLVPPLVL